MRAACAHPTVTASDAGGRSVVFGASPHPGRRCAASFLDSLQSSSPPVSSWRWPPRRWRSRRPWSTTSGSGEPEPIELGPLAQRSYVYAADGQLLAALKDEENRQPVPLAEVPPHVVDAILAVEDAGFWIHDGYDVRGMLRAFRANVDSGGISQGGSTITQQLVKLNLLDDEQTLDRKVQEIVLAPAPRAADDEGRDPRPLPQHRLLREPRLRRPGRGRDLLRRGRRSSSTWARRRCSPASSATRSSTTPCATPSGRPQRREVALDRMVDAGWLTEEEAVVVARGARPRRSFHQVLPKPNDYFPSEVEQQLLTDPRFAMLGETEAERRKAVYQGGLRVYTTLDPAGAAAGAGGPRLGAPARERRRPAAGREPRDRRAEPGHGRRSSSVEPATGAVRTMVGGPGLRQLQVQPRHPEPAGRRVVDEDVRAGDDHGAGLLARRHHQRHRPLQLRRPDRGGRGLRRQQLRRRRRFASARSPRPRWRRPTARSCGWA